MSAQTTLKAGIKQLSEDMLSYDGSEGKTKADADEYYATKLASLIDAHAKALVAKVSAAEIAALGLVAGANPVAPAPVPVPGALSIDDLLL